MAVPTQSQLDYYYYFALRVFFSVFMKKTKQMQETERQICETAAVVHYVDNVSAPSLGQCLSHSGYSAVAADVPYERKQKGRSGAVRTGKEIAFFQWIDSIH